MLERPSEIITGYGGLASTIINGWRRPDYWDVLHTLYYLVSISLPFLALLSICLASRPNKPQEQ